MANRVYFRCSTDGQDFTQQQKCVTDYLTRAGVVADDVITEKVSGTIKHTERKLSELLAMCQAGDVVYVSELSRLGRCMADLFAIVSDATDKGVKLVQCKDGSTIEAESIGGKALLFALSLAAEIEVANIRQRTQMGLDARKEAIKRDGGFMSKSGRWCTRLGREKGVDMSAANRASALAATNGRLEWLQESAVGKYVQSRMQQGWTFTQILGDLQRMYEISPEVYCTRTGKPVGKGQLSVMMQHYRGSTAVAEMSEADRRNGGKIARSAEE